MRRIITVGLATSALLCAGGAATAVATPGTDHKQSVCHPKEGGWVLIHPDKASSHIDENLYPDGHYWKHEHDGRHDVYANDDGTCPPVDNEPTPEPTETTPTPSPTTSTPEPTETTPEPTTTSHPDPSPTTSTPTPPSDLPETRQEVISDSFCDLASGLTYTVKETITYKEVWEESPVGSGVWVLVDEIVINDAWEYIPGDKCAKDEPSEPTKKPTKKPTKAVVVKPVVQPTTVAPAKAPVVAPATPSQELAYTGIPVGPALGVAALLLAIGAFMTRRASVIRRH